MQKQFNKLNKTYSLMNGSHCNDWLSNKGANERRDKFIVIAYSSHELNAKKNNKL